jgi:hypothetical protein
VLKVVDLNLVDHVVHITPQKNSSGVKSGNLGGQAIGPPLPIHLTVQVIPNMVAEMWQRAILLEDSLRW